MCAEASAAQAAGADLLNLLHARSKTIVGSARSSRLLQQLLAAAAAPYFEVLTRWVAAGVLNDPFSEFMVVAVPGMRTDAELNGESAFWAGGHRLRTRAGDGGAEEPDMPAFLEEVQDEVLKAGALRSACCVLRALYGNVLGNSRSIALNAPVPCAVRRCAVKREGAPRRDLRVA